jgi:hypothetical protein
MKTIWKHFDTGSLLVIFITFILFTAALFLKGFTHDLFLETGVFLVSVKLILMAYKNSRYINSLDVRLNDILKALDHLDSKNIENE